MSVDELGFGGLGPSSVVLMAFDRPVWLGIYLGVVVKDMLLVCSSIRRAHVLDLAHCGSPGQCTQLMPRLALFHLVSTSKVELHH